MHELLGIVDDSDDDEPRATPLRSKAIHQMAYESMLNLLDQQPFRRFPLKPKPQADQMINLKGESAKRGWKRNFRVLSLMAWYGRTHGWRVAEGLPHFSRKQNHQNLVLLRFARSAHSLKEKRIACNSPKRKKWATRRKTKQTTYCLTVAAGELKINTL